MNKEEIAAFKTKSDKDIRSATTVVADAVWKKLMPLMQRVIEEKTSITSEHLPVDARRKSARTTHNWSLTGK